MRVIACLTLLLASLSIAAPASAQSSIQLNARLGRFKYDAGGTGNAFLQFQLGAERRLAPHVRVGLLASRASVGDVGRPWVVRGSDESIYRLVATGAYEAPPMFKKITPVFSLAAGMVHSAGVVTDFSPWQGSPFFQITNQRTGLAMGAGLTLELPVTPHALLTGSFQAWRDELYGGRMYNLDQMLGVAWRF
jgi:hypothetical protein